MLEQILVLEKALGRKLRKNETVARKNGDKADNRIENLLLMNGNKKAPRELTPDLEKELLRLYPTMKTDVLAKHFRVSTKTLRLWCLALGLHRKSYNESRERIVQAHKTGHSMREIAAALGCSIATISMQLKKAREDGTNSGI